MKDESMDDHFNRLLKGFSEGTLTAAELSEFLELLPQKEELLSDRIFQDLKDGATGERMTREQSTALYEAIVEKASYGQKANGRLRRMFVPAAAAILMLVIGGAFLLQWRSRPVYGHATAKQEDRPQIRPGVDGAILQLANGKQIILDTTAEGTIAVEGSRVSKSKDRLVYAPAETNDLLSYHTVLTPRGRQFGLVLSDGTRIWLNAESSIRFPSVFSKVERRVEVTGEAYFEVAAAFHEGRRIPFLVEGKGMVVEVLGTHFNVNTYADDGLVRTSLLEGRVKLSPAGSAQTGEKKTLILHPGDQGIWSGQKLERMSGVDLEQVMAWKNGLFHFDNENLASILKQLQRWYDFDLRYEDKVDGHYSGVMKRQQDISQVLHLLELAGGVRFTIKEKMVTVHEEKR